MMEEGVNGCARRGEWVWQRIRKKYHKSKSHAVNEI